MDGSPCRGTLANGAARGKREAAALSCAAQPAKGPRGGGDTFAAVERALSRDRAVAAPPTVDRTRRLASLNAARGDPARADSMLDFEKPPVSTRLPGARDRSMARTAAAAVLACALGMPVAA